MSETPASRYGRLVSCSRPAAGLTAGVFLQAGRGQARFYWHDHDPIVFAGVGVAAELFAWGESRFSSIQQQAQALWAEAVVENGREPLAVPRLFGGFAFRPDFMPDNAWSVFHPAHFVLPHYQLLQRGQEAWLTINAQLPAEEDPAAILPALQEALEEKYQQLCQFVPPVSNPLSPAGQSYPMTPELWAEMLNEAIAQMRAGAFNKVVLARVCELKFNRPIELDQALAYLNQQYDGCYRFLFEPRPGYAFLGATPELLAKVQGVEFATMALAGSIGRGKTAAEDAELAQALLDSPKDRYEHDLVVQSLKRRLIPLTTSLTMPAEPTILPLSNIQHLYTPVMGQLPAACGALPLLEQLHPTPALGGSPREQALRFMQQNEPVSRGWYAAPIGWLDHQLDGVFGVAIRSAVCQPGRAWLYAGAGIVAESDPDKEWLETELKFRPMQKALGQ